MHDPGPRYPETAGWDGARQARPARLRFPDSAEAAAVKIECPRCGEQVEYRQRTVQRCLYCGARLRLPKWANCPTPPRPMVQGTGRGQKTRNAGRSWRQRRGAEGDRKDSSREGGIADGTTRATAAARGRRIRQPSDRKRNARLRAGKGARDSRRKWSITTPGWRLARPSSLESW